MRKLRKEIRSVDLEILATNVRWEICFKGLKYGISDRHRVQGEYLGPSVIVGTVGA